MSMGSDATFVLVFVIWTLWTGWGISAAREWFRETAARELESTTRPPELP